MKLDKQKNFIDYLFKRKLYTLSITFCIAILLSLICLFKIPLEVMPKENVEPFLFLSVRTAVSSLEYNESEKAILVEGVIKSLPNVTQYLSKVSNTQVTFLINYMAKTNMDLAFVQLQEAMQALDSDQKIIMTDVSISKFNPDATSVIKLSVVSIDKDDKKAQVSIKEFKDSLESIDEIAKVEMSGEQSVTIKYDINKEKFDELKDTNDVLFKKLNSLVYKENLGFIKNKLNTKELSIGAKVIANNVNEIEKTTIMKDNGPTVKQLSQKSLVHSSSKYIAKSNGQDVVFLEVYNKENSDLLSLKEKINNLIENKFLNSGLKIEYLFNRTEDLKKAISDVKDELIGSIIITFFVVLFFLRKFKITSIICVSIPTSILITIGVLYLNGKTLNILTLSGLILSIGLTVDNSIVVAERIEGLKEEGMALIEACINGVKEVSMPLLSSTLTSIIIFLPVAFVEGGDSFTSLLKIFQFPVIISLIVSYFVALFFVPLMSIILSHFRAQSPPLKKDSSVGANKGQYQGERFVPILSFVSKKFALILLICSLLTLSVWDYVKDIEETDLESPKEKAYTIKVKFGAELTENQKRDGFLEIEKSFDMKKDQLHSKSVVSDFSVSSLVGMITFYPKSYIESDEEIDNFRSEIEKEVEKYKERPGIFLVKEGEYSSDFSSKFQSKKITIEGPRRYILLGVLNTLKEKLKDIDGVVQINNDDEESGSKYFLISLSLDKMKSLGVAANDITKSLSSMSQVLKMENIEYKDGRYNVEINIINNEPLLTLEDLLNFKVYYDSKGIKNQNVFTVLKEIGDVTEARALSSFTRNLGLVKSKLTIYYDKNINRSVSSQVDNILSSVELPRGVRFPDDSYNEKFEEMKKNSSFIIYLSIFLIYLLLASLFESILIPLAVLFTVPISFLYGVLALKFLGYQLDPMARLGLLILVGTAVSNAIILIDMIGKLRTTGIAKRDAIILGVSKRVDAVFMSTTASVLGLIPVALGSSKIMGIPYSTLGICIISGLIFSAILTLVVLPIFYQLFTNIEEKFISFRKDIY